MAILGRLGKTAWTASKGGRRLQRAAHEAERSPESELSEAERLEVRPTLPQAALLVRYIAGRFVLGVMETYFLWKWGFLVLALPFLFGIGVERDGVSMAIGVFFVVLFVIAAIAQWFATRAVRRVGALDKLADLEDFGFDAVVDWWPNLRAEFRRVGLPPSAGSMLRLGASYAARRLGPEQKAALEQVNWFAVLPVEQLNAAHKVLARAAGDAE